MYNNTRDDDSNADDQQRAPNIKIVFNTYGDIFNNGDNANHDA